jgi:hypothetical protein
MDCNDLATRMASMAVDPFDFYRGADRQIISAGRLNTTVSYSIDKQVSNVITSTRSL